MALNSKARSFPRTRRLTELDREIVILQDSLVREHSILCTKLVDALHQRSGDQFLYEMAARVACTGRSIIFTPEILLNFAITRTKPYWLNGELLSETELNDLTRIPGLAEYVHAFVSIEQRILERAREAKYL